MVGYVQVLLVLLAAKFLFDVPMLGSVSLLLGLVLLFIVANLAVGITFSTIAKNQLQAVQMAFFFFLPSLLLSGYMFPFRGMPGWAQDIGECLPLTHFLRIVRGILLKGNGLAECAPDLWPIAAVLRGGAGHRHQALPADAGLKPSFNLRPKQDAGLLVRMNSCKHAWRLAFRIAGLKWSWLGLLFWAAAVQAEDPQGTNLWSCKLDLYAQAQGSLSTPAVAADGTIYVGSFGGTLLAFSPEGKQLWEFPTGKEIRSSPAIADDGTVYFGGRDRQFYALTPQGKMKWKFATGGWVDSSAAIAANGTVYFGSWDRNFYAVNPDGTPKWKFTAGGVVNSSPAIALDGTIYFGAHNRKFFALDPEGKVRWTFPVGAEIASSPAIGYDGDVYFSSADGNLYRLKADGTEVWHHRIGGGGDGSPVLMENGYVVIAAADQTLFLAPDGTEFWKLGTAAWVDQTPVATHDAVLFSAPGRKIWAVNTDKKLVWYLPTVDDDLTSSPVLGNHGEIYFCCGRWLQAGQPPTPLQPARSSWPMFRADARHTGRVGQ